MSALGDVPRGCDLLLSAQFGVRWALQGIFSFSPVSIAYVLSIYVVLLVLLKYKVPFGDGGGEPRTASQNPSGFASSPSEALCELAPSQPSSPPLGRLAWGERTCRSYPSAASAPAWERCGRGPRGRLALSPQPEKGVGVGFAQRGVTAEKKLRY